MRMFKAPGAARLVKTGFDALPEATRGAHLCVFYESTGDLVDLLTRFYAAGLEGGDLCLASLHDEGARAELSRRLREVVPSFDDYVARGAFGFTSLPVAGAADGFEPDSTAAFWLAKEREAVARGFDGLRGNGDLAWLGDGTWSALHVLEEKLQTQIAEQQILILCAYPLGRYGAAEIFDAARTHHLVLARRGDRWEALETEELYTTKRELNALRAQLERRVVERTRQLTEANEQLQVLTRRLVDLQEAERRNIATELHDRVGQTLTAMRINADMIRKRLDESDDALIRGRNDDSLELIESAFKAVKNVMYDLRPPMLEEHGVALPLQWYAGRFTERTGIHVDVLGDPRWRGAPEIEIALFRVAQEALNNVARHAGASRVSIDFKEVGPDIVLTIEDDGVGFERDTERLQTGYGLIGMRERANSVGGTFEALSQKGRGTCITMTVPRGSA